MKPGDHKRAFLAQKLEEFGKNAPFFATESRNLRPVFKYEVQQFIYL